MICSEPGCERPFMARGFCSKHYYYYREHGVIKKTYSTHGRSGTPEYYTWQNMKKRCDDVNNPRYDDYGGRGISYDDRWRDFNNFYRDMGPRPKGMTLDRIDNNKGYSAENCRWASRKQQQRNMRRNRFVEWNGESRTVSEWAEILQVNKSLIISRLNRGWPIEKTMTKPSERKQNGVDLR